ncbi:helix-turn-helix domain-containing protein [Xanthobacter flavus]|uniref:helix-turn-helix domain-containing protein n=1 Tax=Xanthobacter flavus TaxID=281 RepID=UPI00372834F0
MMARHGLGPRVTVEDVLRAVCQRYDVRRIDLLSHRRTARVLLPRQLAMYLARDLTLSSLPKIGRLMGGRDHTTVLHACQQIEARIKLNPELARDVAALSCTISATSVERVAAERRWVAA